MDNGVPEWVYGNPDDPKEGKTMVSFLKIIHVG